MFALFLPVLTFVAAVRPTEHDTPSLAEVSQTDMGLMARFREGWSGLFRPAGSVPHGSVRFADEQQDEGGSWKGPKRRSGYISVAMPGNADKLPSFQVTIGDGDEWQIMDSTPNFIQWKDEVSMYDYSWSADCESKEYGAWLETILSKLAKRAKKEFDGGQGIFALLKKKKKEGEEGNPDVYRTIDASLPEWWDPQHIFELRDFYRFRAVHGNDAIARPVRSLDSPDFIQMDHSIDNKNQDQCLLGPKPALVKGRFNR